MLRVVLDTNVLLSAFIWRGAVSQVLYTAENKEFRIVVSEDILSEFSRVISREKFLPRLQQVNSTPSLVLDQISALVEIVEPIRIPDILVRDPKDVMLLECAVAGNVDYLVSGDKDLTVLENYQGISIVTPAKFLEILASAPDAKENS